MTILLKQQKCMQKEQEKSNLKKQKKQFVKTFDLLSIMSNFLVLRHGYTMFQHFMNNASSVLPDYTSFSWA